MELIIAIFSLILWLIIAAFFIVVILFTFHHADMIATSEKPLSKIDKGASWRFLRIIFWFLVTIVILIIIEGLIQQRKPFVYIASPAMVYISGSLCACWVISYKLPSIRKKEVKRRKKVRKAT